jgi:hypothetical protein
MSRVDHDKAAGALLGLAAGGDGAIAEMALLLASTLIERGGYDAEAARRAYGDRLTGASVVARTTPNGIAFAGRDEALRDATIADAALADFEPLEGKIALLHNQVVAWSLTGGPELVFHNLKEPEWLDDRIEDVVIPATSGVLDYATSLARSEPDSALAALAVGLAAFFNAEGFEAGLEWAAGLLGARAAVAGALLGARHGAVAIPERRLGGVERRSELEGMAGQLAAMAG